MSAAGVGNLYGPRTPLYRIEISVGERGSRQCRQRHADDPLQGMGFNPTQALGELLGRCEGGEAYWWSPNGFERGQCDAAQWNEAAAVALVLDHFNARGELSENGNLLRLVTAWKAEHVGSLAYGTPRGLVTVWPYRLPVTSRRLHRRAVEGACAQTREALSKHGLLARCDAPGRYVGGYTVRPDCAALDAVIPFRDRTVSLHGLGIDGYNPWELAGAAPALDGFGLAGTAPCPMCGAADAFGRSPVEPGQWVCIAPGHEATECGTRAGVAWIGDAASLEAFANREQPKPAGSRWQRGAQAVRRILTPGGAGC